LPQSYQRVAPRHVINGIDVYGSTSYGAGSYFLPSMGVEVIFQGPLGPKVLDTLSRSPRAVVLANGPSASLQSSWRRVGFDGIALRVPRSWPTSRTVYFTDNAEQCGVTPAAFVGPHPGFVLLDTDQEVGVVHCFFVSWPPPQKPVNGVQVDARSQALRGWHVGVSFSGQCLKVNELRVCPATSPVYSILVLKVSVPGRSKPVYVSISLAGNGMIARTILYSLRAT
jgi:hypothetical protein